MKWIAAVAAAALMAAIALDVRAQDVEGSVVPATIVLRPTAHPAVPDRVSDFWYVPEIFPPATNGRTETAAQKFARGARLIDDGNFAAGLTLVASVDLSGTPLTAYSRYYRAIAFMGLNRLSEALAILDGLAAEGAAGADGYIHGEGVPLRRAELEVARLEADDAVDVLADLSKKTTVTTPEEVWLRLGRAAEAAGDRDKAIDAYRKVYYEFPLSLQALDAQSLLARLDTAPLAERFTLELVRAERIFSARRWAQARAGFEPLLALASGDEKELVALRLAECDYYLERFRAARDGVRPFVKDASRKAEARFFYLTATRALGDTDTYLAEARALVEDFPDSSWAAETLNNLASHYVVLDDDAKADEAFRELWRRFPTSRYAERAAWKIGWWAYKNGRFADAAQAFEAGAAAFPRADMRPAWIYWSGRAHDQIGETAIANDRYRLEVADYENSYYGRLAAKILASREEPAGSDTFFITPTSGTLPIPTAGVIRQLVGLELYEPALRELQYAQRAWGDSPAIAATVAWIRHEQAQHETAPDRFDHLRGAITTMKRAYPQYLASRGEELPPQVLAVIFPLDYWPLIEQYSKANDLDPYLMAALIAQESTFTADIRSGANAYGLMQLLPSTGRLYARKAGLGRFTNAMLTQPEANIRMGMRYFKDLSDRLGGAHFALASYNAGPNKVAQWLAERPGLPDDEFIDDIPYPETQNYVKRILGTAEDYRRLYGGGLLQPDTTKKAPPIKRVTVQTKKPAKKAPITKASSRKPKTTSRTNKTR